MPVSLAPCHVQARILRRAWPLVMAAALALALLPTLSRWMQSDLPQAAAWGVVCSAFNPTAAQSLPQDGGGEQTRPAHCPLCALSEQLPLPVAGPATSERIDAFRIQPAWRTLQLRVRLTAAGIQARGPPSAA